MTTFTIQSATLNVTNLQAESEFYQKIMGLTIIRQSETDVELGIEGSSEGLLNLHQVTESRHQMSGLYHIAYLLPNRSDLGSFLEHLIASGYPVQGASNHGYSEAVYLADPEGNGIEVYVDKPRDQWDIRGGGVIVGVTEQMDGQGVLDSADKPFSKMVSGSFIGHIHLAASDLPKTSAFFSEVLGFTITTAFGNQAAFFGKNGYHHQFAANIWTGRNLPENDGITPGLAEITIQVSQEVLDATLKKLEDTQHSFKASNESLSFRDTNGIRFRYLVDNSD